MAINEKALDDFLNEDPIDTGEVPDDIRKVLERIWEKNDSLSVKRGRGYCSKQRAVEFFRSQGIRCNKETLTHWARLAGRFSWDQK